jgi:ribosomal protein S18 acetylase RimI-like enzyme
MPRRCGAREEIPRAIRGATARTRGGLYPRIHRADSAQFVALDEGRVIGWADIIAARAHAMAHCGFLGMGLAATHRGRGIGRRLLETTIAKAWSKGITRIVLDVRADNTNAIALYEKVGFVVEARKVNALKFDDEYFDAFQMFLLAEP